MITNKICMYVLGFQKKPLYHVTAIRFSFPKSNSLKWRWSVARQKQLLLAHISFKCCFLVISSSMDRSPKAQALNKDNDSFES